MRNQSPRPRRSDPSVSSNFVLGRARFARICAVEGIVLTHEMRATLDRFDREGLSAEERRLAILRHFASVR
jgi:hypothetical protein